MTSDVPQWEPARSRVLSRRMNLVDQRLAAPFISDIRRSLQREYLGLVEPLVRYQPGAVLSPDLHAMVRHSLTQLDGHIDEVLKGGRLDFASQAHLSACKSRIERLLEPELDEYTHSPVTFPTGM